MLACMLVRLHVFMAFRELIEARLIENSIVTKYFIFNFINNMITHTHLNMIILFFCVLVLAKNHL